MLRMTALGKKLKKKLENIIFSSFCTFVKPINYIFTILDFCVLKINHTSAIKPTDT